MRYDVTLNGLTPQQEQDWTQAMTAAGHIIRVPSMAPVAPAGTAAPAPLPIATPAFTPPAVNGLTWQQANNRNGFKAPDPVLRDGRYPAMWLYNDDSRPLRDGRPGSFVVKCRIMGQWFSINDRDELVRQFAPHADSAGYRNPYPMTTQPAPRRRARA